MDYRYTFPLPLADVDVRHPERISQNVGEHSLMSPNTKYNQEYGLSGTDMSPMNNRTPRGIGAGMVRVYNFTRSPLLMVDSNNNAVVLEPPFNQGGSDVIVIDVYTYNQDERLSNHTANFMKARSEALAGFDIHEITRDQLSDADRNSNINQCYRFNIPVDDRFWERYENGFYFEFGNICVGRMNDPANVLIHPDSRETVLRKCRPHDTLKTSIGIDIGVNDPDYKFDRLFTLIFGTVCEVPITRDPTRPEGISAWFDVGGKGTRPDFMPLDLDNAPVALFTSVDAAKSGGIPEKVVEAALLEAKLDLADKKLAAEQEEFDRELTRRELNHKALQEKLDHEREYRASETERKVKEDRHRHHVENVSFARKTLVEVVKMVGAIAATATIVIGWLAKRKAT